jgi:hypothetical protein
MAPMMRFIIRRLPCLPCVEAQSPQRAPRPTRPRSCRRGARARCIRARPSARSRCAHSAGVSTLLDGRGCSLTRAPPPPPVPPQAYGIPPGLLVVGKPNNFADAIDAQGWVTPATLGQWVASATAQLGWMTGVASFYWAGPNSQTWLSGVYPNPITNTSLGAQLPTCRRVRT